MSRAAVSLATTQPRSSRPRTSGRMPCGSRAAYRVFSSMKIRLNAPLTFGRISAAASSMVRSGYPASIEVRMSVSDDAPCLAFAFAWSTSASRPRSRSPSPFRLAASSLVLVRLPLWPSAIEPVAVERNVGCALAHTLEPVVEYRQWPIAMWPRSEASVASSKAWLTSPMSL